jgi:single-strand DNA-binding protein
MKTIGMGRLTADPDIRYGTNGTAVGSFTLACTRRMRIEGDPEADFFHCVAFGKRAEFVEKYLRKGSKIEILGTLQNNNYTKPDGSRVYGDQIIIEEIEFAESKGSGESAAPKQSAEQAPTQEGFMNVPDGIDDELPFK